MNKKELSERDICTKFITPALTAAGWDLLTQIREEVFFTKGRVIVHGKKVKRGEAKRADYLLSYKPGIPLAIIEAKDNNHTIAAGMQKALAYADKKALELLGAPGAGKRLRMQGREASGMAGVAEEVDPDRGGSRHRGEEPAQPGPNADHCRGSRTWSCGVASGERR